jgi:integrase/recombinase XerD
LAPYATGFKDDLVQQGYRSTMDQLYVMAQMSHFLSAEGIDGGELSETRARQFLCWRASVGYLGSMSTRRVSPLLEHLIGIGVVPVFSSPTLTTAVEVLMARYTTYLSEERGLADSSIRHYVDVAHAISSSTNPLENLTTAAVTSFVLVEAKRCSVASAKAMTTRLRSFLRFCFVEGLTERALAGAVPSVASWRLGVCPRSRSRSPRVMSPRCWSAAIDGHRSADATSPS